MNPKEECKVIFTRRESAEKEKRIEEDVHDEEGEKKKKEKKISKESGDEVSTTKTKTKSQLAREARREIPLASSKEAPYPLVPSKKDKECYFKRFLDIFLKLEVTIPFG